MQPRPLTLGLGRGRDLNGALQPFDPKPKHCRWLSLAAFPLVDHSFRGRAHFVGELLLTQAESGPQADERGRVVRRHDHPAHGSNSLLQTQRQRSSGLLVPPLTHWPASLIRKWLVLEICAELNLSGSD